jgi:hypothetical protein
MAKIGLKCLEQNENVPICCDYYAGTNFYNGITDYGSLLVGKGYTDRLRWSERNFWI